MIQAHATFKILNVFKLRNRGLILAGERLDGQIQIGNDITFVVDGEIITKKIIDLSNFRTMPSSNQIGLLIQCENIKEIEEIKNTWKLNDTISTITQ